MFTSRPRRPGTGRVHQVPRPVLAPVLAAASIALAACGGAAPAPGHRPGPPGAASHRSPGGGGLCTATATLDSLTVTRTDAFPENHIRFTFPARVTVSDPASAQAVARVLCGLRGPGAPAARGAPAAYGAPAAHGAAIACPINLGVTYQLSFASPGRRFAPVSVGATGCELVRGLAATRWVRGSPLLWRTLGTAMHLPSPGNAAFRGSPPQSARN
ncbi:MAG TPA: hypothetical protein VKV80_10015 [Streptosporangiaceae bacterium]|nr:hypothetical protein [Streptosporangiaceae bacterium]